MIKFGNHELFCFWHSVNHYSYQMNCLPLPVADLRDEEKELLIRVDMEVLQ